MVEITRGACPQIKDSSGITLLEVLITIFIFTTLVSILPIVFSIWNQPKTVAITYEEKVLFTSQLQLDYRTSTSAWINGSGTILYFRRLSDNAIVQYELYQDKIRRRVNSSGHEVFLQNVKKLNLKKCNYGIELTITGMDGRDYWHAITHPNDVILSVNHE